MPLVTGKLWNRRARWMGNVLPALVYLPFLFAGAYLMYDRAEFIGLGLWIICAGLVLAWFALNFLGLPGNAFRRRQLRRELNDVEPLPEDAVFVGYASPGYRDVLDSIEDVGFLVFDAGSLRFRGETHQLVFRRPEVRAIELRPNAHSTLMLGGWIVIVTGDGTPANSHRFESRQRDTLLGNRAERPKLRGRLMAWLKDSAIKKTANPGQ